MNAIRWLVATWLMIALTGCSTFDRDFEAARQSKASVPSASIWDGTWKSEAGHGGGRLRAILTPTASDTYHARFRAQYWGIFAADEDVDLHVTSTAPTTRASGEADLGFFKGGVYQYDATITPSNFDATYKSKYDHGQFDLRRLR
ncbi:MAG: hypothetical protein JWN40_2136 [Phycisphaerales bacterium]|nr:hypothetical protein [Phycisphaerales bacterium]